MKKTLQLFIALFTVMTVNAQLSVGGTFVIGDLTYEVTSTTPLEVEVSDDGDTTATDVTITSPVMDPGSIESYEVTAIGDNAFQSNASVVNVVLPTSVKTIGEFAFNSCSSLVSINLENIEDVGGESLKFCESLIHLDLSSVQNIGFQAFRQNSTVAGGPALSTVNFGSSFSTHSTNVFHDCTNLTDVQLNWPDAASIIDITSGSLFSGTTPLDQSVNLLVPTTTSSNYTGTGWDTNFNIVEGTLSNDVYELTSNVNAYPNPTNGIVNLTVEGDITVLDLTGKTIITKFDTSVVDLSGLVSGVYVVKISTPNNIVVNHRIIKK